jgi:hypothetical protein
MSNITITNIDQGSVILQDAEFRDEILAFLAAGTLLEGTLLARKSVASAVVAAPGGSDTGDGTLTLSTVAEGLIVPLVGAYNLECISAAVAAGTATATASAVTGSGDGTVTAVTVAADAVGVGPGAYVLTMTELGTKNGVAIGAASGAGTGNGTASAVVAGALAKAGDYLVTCTNADASGSEIFQVIDPDGEILEDLTVGVAYLNSHFGITISDGTTDFTVGYVWTITITDTGGLFELVSPGGSMIKSDIVMDAGALQATAIVVNGVSFTITAGATDFIVGDYFTITIANTVGIWKLEDPNDLLIDGNLKMTAGAGSVTAFIVGGLAFTLTDGATDFIVGDSFSLTVAADGDLVPFATDGTGGAQVPLAILTYAVTVTAASDVAIRAGVSGSYRKERLVIDADGDASNITNAIMDQLRHFGLVPIDVKQLSVLDNQ